MTVFTYLGIAMGLMFGAMTAAILAGNVAIEYGFKGFVFAVLACLLLGLLAVFGGWGGSQAGYYP